jgi:hypothetical protein
MDKFEESQRRLRTFLLLLVGIFFVLSGFLLISAFLIYLKVDLVPVRIFGAFFLVLIFGVFFIIILSLVLHLNKKNFSQSEESEIKGRKLRKGSSIFFLKIAIIVGVSFLVFQQVVPGGIILIEFFLLFIVFCIFANLWQKMKKA